MLTGVRSAFVRSVFFQAVVLGLAYWFAVAEPLAQRSLAIREKALGADHLKSDLESRSVKTCV